MDRNLLARATEGTDAPTPGYLYVDLAKAATANPSACADMATYLTRKLASKQNPNVKAKCCKVIAKLAEDVPRNQFRRTICQDAAAVATIKEAINFRGPMDPVQGDAKNEKVRAAAREALDAIYKETPSSESAVSMPGMSAMSASYASAPHSSGGYGGEGGGRRMEGIGNPNYSDPRNDPRYNGSAQNSVKEIVQEAGEVLKGMIMDPLARNVGNPHHAHSDVPSRGHSGNLPGYGPQYGRPPPGASELSRQTGGQWTMASNRGPGATSQYQKEPDAPGGFNSWNSGAATSATAGVPGGSWGATPSVASQAREPAYGTPSVSVVNNPAASASAVAPTASDGTFEKNLILELCPPGGVGKPVPPADKLARFASSVSSLNADLICPVLLDFIEDGQPWIIRAKALCVMEVAIQNGMSVAAAGTNPYKTFFHACAHEIQPLAVHPRTAISAPAKRVLLLLGITPGPVADAGPPAAQAAPPAPAAEAPNLLDFDDAPTTAPPSQPPPPPPAEAPPVAPPPAAAPPAAAPSMFGGMTVKGAAEQPAAAAPAPPAVAPPAPAAGSLLDFSSSDAFEPAAAAATTMEPPKVETATTAATASMFGDLSVKEEKEDLAPPAPSGSAFGFINKDAAPAAPPAPAATQPTPQPTPASPKSFDPLDGLGGGGSTATSMPTAPASPQGKQAMPLSTEQMQAMAYQQMMMQQQQQQLQMMYMMQRGMVVPPPQAMQFRQSSGSGGGGSASMLTSGYQAKPGMVAKKDDKKFDFVKDTMISEKKK